MKTIAFNTPTCADNELQNLQEVMRSGRWGGGGPWAQRCLKRMTQTFGLQTAQGLLTHSCTASLELCALLLELNAGDEVIMPSFTFPSTANAVALRRAVPVFVDIRQDTLNIDETRIEAAITPRTRAIIVVHYAGVCCEMDTINHLAQHYKLRVIEDAAQAYLSRYHGRPAGFLGDMSAFSFHETKNLSCGEGGAFFCKSSEDFRRAEILCEKGTNRHEFLRGEVDRYTWRDIGSTFLLSDIHAAVLDAQIQQANAITQRRLQLWQCYHQALAPLEFQGLIRRPIIPPHVESNGHIYYLILNSSELRDRLMQELRNHHINCPFHFIPLHSAPAGIRHTRTAGALPQTEDLPYRLLRLPLHQQLLENDIQRVTDTITACLSHWAS